MAGHSPSTSLPLPATASTSTTPAGSASGSAIRKGLLKRSTGTSTSILTSSTPAPALKGHGQALTSSALQAQPSSSGSNTQPTKRAVMAFGSGTPLSPSFPEHHRAGQGQAGGQGLQFSKQPWTSQISWAKIKRRLLLASTGTPSSGEGRSETSGTSADSRQQLANAYALAQAKKASLASAPNNNTNNNAGTAVKQVHMEDDEDEGGGEDWHVDQVVVDSEYWDDDGNLLEDGTMAGSVSRGAGGGGGGYGGERMSNSGQTTTAHSETAGSLIANPTFKAIDGIITFFRGYLIPKCQYFFEPRFGDDEKEENFRKERWYNTKRNAWFGSCFLIINWALTLGVSSFPETYQKVMWYGLYTLFTWPLPVMVACDMPKKHYNIYGIWAALATCSVGWYGVIMLKQCHFLKGGNCAGNQFLSLMFNASVLPFLGLFALHVNRFYIACGQLVFWILVCALALPEKGSFARQVVNYLLFSLFIQYLHYSQEKIDRRMYTLRSQLKISYRAQQKAQIAEKKANNSKKRFISYIFHEVRVPLNTAYLAFQNLQAGNSFDAKDEDQMVEVYALETSLQQVQQVLNDVLDLQRMDAGRFESSSQPFHFHRAINALVASLKVATTAKKLGLHVSLDERIDALPQSIDWTGAGPGGPRATFVVGDEIRLRQVLTNLASNAVKFSREGKGKISVVTKLIWPTELELAQAQGQGQGQGLSKTSSRISIIGGHTDVSQAITPASVDEKGRILAYIDSDGTEKTAVSARGSLSRDGHAALLDDSGREIDIEKHAGADTRTHELDKAGHGNDIPVIRQDHALPKDQPPVMPPQPVRLNSDDSSESERQEKLARRQCVIVRIEIADNGPGIKPSDLVDNRLFSPYVQTEVGRTQGGKGSGLGLAIVRAIVQLARGRLGVQSSRNGSTFWLEFRYPLALPSEVEVVQPPPVTPMSIASAPTASRVGSPDRPVRPPVKPYRNGESSWSQYSGSRHEAQSEGFPVTPLTEKDRPFAAHSKPPSGMSAASQPRPSTSESKRASAQSLPSPPSQAGSAGRMDTSNPLGSEQWQGGLERSVLPSMTLTSPTPPSGNSSTTIPTTTSRRQPSPSPPLPRADGAHPGMAMTAAAQVERPSSASSLSRAPLVSPPGEEAFTPLTREAVKAMTDSPSLFAASNPNFPPIPLTTLPAAPAASVLSADRPLSVLVVDDDPLTRKLMTRMIAKMGCVTEEAENGQLCLDVLFGIDGNSPRHFDLVTLDCMMPVLTGEQAIRALRAAGRDDFVVGATGNALRSDQSSYLGAGIDYIMTKPISAKDVRKHLDEARQRRDRKDAAAQAQQ